MKKNLSVLLSLFLFVSPSLLLAEVIDSAGFFSPSVVQEANQKIKEINRKTGKNLVVETVPSLDGKNPSQYAISQARSRRVNGVYVLLAKKEKKIEIRTGSNTRKVFGTFEASTFKTKITENFKKKQFDAGLIESVSYYSGVLSSATTKRKPSGYSATTTPVRKQSSSGGFSLFKWLFIGLILFLIFRVVSSFLSRGNNNSYGNQGPGGYGNGYNQGGGMGFMGTLLTGMLGAAAGSWLYDQFTGNDSGLSASDHMDSSSYSDSSYSDNSWSQTDDYSDYSSGDSGSFDGGGGFDGGGDW